MNKGEDIDYISKKKPAFPVTADLRSYIKEYDREADLPVLYKDLKRYTSSFPLYNKEGEDTLWETIMFEKSDLDEINKGLAKTYALLRTAGNLSVMEHLYVNRIDYCTFGNSNPFRIRIVNQFNDNYDYFYIKKADSSRIYGLELEHMLSPNRINYLVDKNTLVEDHIAGIPGDQFIKDYLYRSTTNKVRIAKEFIKFNERCFVRLLGDMRSYNYVIDITPDFEDEQYRVRAIDFDQQSYEGKRTLYQPQFFKENNPIVQFCIDLITNETVKQYQQEERTLMAKRVYSSRYKLKELLDCMRANQISTPAKIEQLKKGLNVHHKTSVFNECNSMGDLVRLHLKVLLN